MRLEYYTATWCSPCKIFGPIVESVITEFDVDYEKIVIDETPERIKSDIMSVPTIVMYQDGEEVSRIIGGRSEYDLHGWIASGGI